MGKKYKFDKNFIKLQIKRGEDILKSPTNQDEVTDIQLMLNYFYSLLNTNKSNDYYDEKIDIIFKLSSFLNKTYTMFNEETWRDLFKFCNEQTKYIVGVPNLKHDRLSDEKYVTNTINFYKSIDDTFYCNILRIVNNPYNLINFNNNNRTQSSCHRVEYLNVPFINISKEAGMTQIITVHEFQHGIDFLNKDQKIDDIFIETNPIMMEMLYTDINYTKKSYHLERISSIISSMNNISDFIKIMLFFKEQNFDPFNITIRDIYKSKIFGNNIEYTLKRLEDMSSYKRIKDIGYILSMLKALELRNEYYSTGKINKSDLNNSDQIDIKKLGNHYINHINNIRKK